MGALCHRGVYRHRRKVTQKGAKGGAPEWEQGIFIAASALLALTFLGMVINASPDLQIVRQNALVPLVAFWGSLNCILLMLVAMLCLQSSLRRAEERFEVDEPMMVLRADGSAFSAPIIDLSVSGAALSLPNGAALTAGDEISLVIRNVGLVRARVMRERAGKAGVVFDLSESLERDLMIRKIFTSGLDTARASVAPSTWMVMFSLLERIFTLDPSLVEHPAEPEQRQSAPEEKMPAQSWILPPTHGVRELEQAATKRLALVA